MWMRLLFGRCDCDETETDERRDTARDQKSGGLVLLLR